MKNVIDRIHVRIKPVPLCYLSEGKLAVIKDSFANCLVPLLVGDYKEIVMIDMRYFVRRQRLW